MTYWRITIISLAAMLVAFTIIGALGGTARADLPSGPITDSATPTDTSTPPPTLTQSPTPNSPTPTVFPTYAGPQSRIRFVFIRQGVPVGISALTYPGSIRAEGVQCLHLNYSTQEAFGFEMSWPLSGISSSQRYECLKAPPTLIRYEVSSQQFGLLSAEVLWTGSDQTVYIEVEPGAPAELPRTGGAPAAR